MVALSWMLPGTHLHGEDNNDLRTDIYSWIFEALDNLSEVTHLDPVLWTLFSAYSLLLTWSADIHPMELDIVMVGRLARG